jgi:hypothetical protein
MTAKVAHNLIVAPIPQLFIFPGQPCAKREKGARRAISTPRLAAARHEIIVELAFPRA